jgi:hypothetical protein
MAQMSCPHCGVLNADAGAFCESCGKALPATEPEAPRIVSGVKLASTPLGRRLQVDDIRKQARNTARALLLVAILQAIVGTFLILMMQEQGRVRNLALPLIMIYGIAAVFLGLYFWARRQPLPAAIAGLAIFVTLHVVEGLIDPNAIAQGLLLKIIVVAVLARGISAGPKYRQLQQAGA